MPYESNREQLMAQYEARLNSGMDNVSETLQAGSQANLRKYGAVKGGPEPPQSREFPAARLGTLANSIGGDADGLDRRVGIKKGAAEKYALIHEFGGVITQQRGGKSVRITIPKRSYMREALKRLSRSGALLRAFARGAGAEVSE